MSRTPEEREARIANATRDFVRDEGLFNRAVTRGELASLAGTIGTILNHHVMASTRIARGQTDEALDMLESANDGLLDLLDELRDLVAVKEPSR